MKRLRRAATVMTILGALTLLAAACGSGGSGSPSSSSSATARGPVNVLIKNFAYLPQKITITAGTTVIWTNEDSVQHTVTSADGISTAARVTSLFDSGLFSQGATFSYTFAKPGTYFYECTIHRSLPAMHGEVIVH